MSFVPPVPLGKALTACLKVAQGVFCIAILLLSARSCLSQEAYTPSTDTNVFAWFKADALNLTNGALVASWRPSGGALHQAVEQTSVSNQPIFQTNQQNGLPAVLFDGMTSFLTNATLFSQPQPLTVFLVYKYLGALQTYGTAFIGSRPGQASWSIRASQGYIGYYIQSESGVSGNLYPIEAPFDATWHILMIVFNGPDSLSRVGGFDAFPGYGFIYSATNMPIAGTLGDSSITSLEMGGQERFLGNVQLGELIIYNGDQGSTNGTNIFNYLGNRWNISLAPCPPPPPFTLNWPDRRPLGMDILFGAEPTTSNPRGWFGNSNIDYVSPSGMLHFSNDLLARASNEITVLKSMNAQGVIIWTPEGCELLNMNYIGDPRKVPILAPEMDKAADAFFGMYKAAGLRVGVCLRPRLFDAGPALPSGTNGQTFVLTTAPFGLKTYYYTNGWVQTNAVPYGGDTFSAYLPELTNKMQYAINRWGASIFYLDSFGGIDVDGPLSLRALTNIARAYPNTLLIPEMGGAFWTNMFCASAPYIEPQYTGFLIPSNVLSVYPKAFMTLCVNSPSYFTNLTAMTASVAAGNIMLANSWYPSLECDNIRQACINAGLSTQLQPPTDLRIMTNSP